MGRLAGRGRPFVSFRRTGRVALALSPWAALAGMLAAGWGKRPDVLHDFGRELYLAWRVSEGDALYRDLAHFNGPLSVWLNASVLRLPGAGIHALLVLNVVLIGVLLVVLRRLLARSASDLASRVGMTAFVVLCATAHLTGIGGFDFVAPYSHEATHGTILAALALLALLRFREAPSRSRAFLAGLLVGLSFLTKVEIALAVGLCTLVVLVIGGRGVEERRPGRGWRAALLAGAALPVAGALLVLVAAMPAGAAAKALAIPWAALLSGGLAAEPFYRTVTGTSDVPGNALRLVAVASVEAAAVAGAALLARQVAKRLPDGGRRPAAAALLVFAAPLLALVALFREWPGLALDAFRPLPVAAAAGLVLALRRRAVPAAVLCLFALVVVLKIAGRCGVHHYGFFLAAPALLVAVVLLLDGVPALARLSRSGRTFYRAAVCGALAALAAAAVARSSLVWSAKTVRVAADRPADSFLADSRGEAVNAALRELRSVMRPGDTLACFPEGTLINYLLRTRNPSPYFVVLPPEVRLFGRDAIVDAFRRAPPDRVVVHARRLEEYGVRTFGRDFMPELGELLARSYRPEVLIGSDPLRSGGFGILVLGRSGPPSVLPAAERPGLASP